MSRYSLNTPEYVSARDVDRELFRALGEPYSGARYSKKGHKKLPTEGGRITLTHYREDTRLYIIRFDVPKTAVLWWKRLNPDITPWDAVATTFSIEGKEISKDLVERVEQALIERKR